jgi:hypothetical protein
MIEGSAILRNMSTPSRTTIRYSGLANLVRRRAHGSVSESEPAHCQNYFGSSRPVLFRLPRRERSTNPKKLLTAIAPDAVTKNPEQEIIRLIEERADQLPLPDGVAVVSTRPGHEQIWDDVLAALAVLTKSSGAVWLRSKAPRLSVLSGRSQISLLVPFSCTDNSKGTPT